MRKFVICLILSVGLSGCATTGGTIPTEDVNAVIAKVQAATRQICGFVPVVSSIAGLLGGDFVDAFAIAQAICSAVSPVPPAGVLSASFMSDAGPVVVARTKSGVVTANVRGVTIKGRFVKAK